MSITIVSTPSTLDWEFISRASAHPLQLAILELLHAVAELDQPERSPRDLARVIDAPLSVVAYHVRQLAKRGLIVLDHTAPKRGALEHFYRLAPGTTA